MCMCLTLTRPCLQLIMFVLLNLLCSALCHLYVLNFVVGTSDDRHRLFKMMNGNNANMGKQVHFSALTVVFLSAASLFSSSELCHSFCLSDKLPKTWLG